MSSALDHTLPEDTDDDLRVQQRRYAQRVEQNVREERELTTLIRDTYRAAWDDFYAQEPVQCTQLLRSLSSTTPSPPPSITEFIQSAEGQPDDLDMDSDPSPPGISLRYWSVDARKASAHTAVAVIDVPHVSSYAYPKYESCTPSCQSIRCVDDLCILRFIPYADEPGFQDNVELITHRYPRLAWQSEWCDVDFKLVVADTYCRLQSNGTEWDKIAMFTARMFPSHGTVLASIRRRDLPSWTSEELHACLKQTSRLAALVPQVDAMASIFCCSLSCNAVRCFPHEYVAEIFPDRPGTKETEDLNAVYDIINNYRQRNYLYNVERSACILDAATVGNPTRYFNDPRDVEKANVEAHPVSVGGDRKIFF
ncbi:hypothetical protein BD414DRAFT_426456, partial [Trametes punicea]